MAVCATPSPFTYLEGKILFIDVETLADQVWTWQRYEANAIKVIRHGHLLTFAYKWLGEDTFVLGQDDSKNYKPRTSDDLGLTKELWRLLDQAEVVVAHNGRSFDLKKITARFIYHNLPPPSPYRIVDTKTEIKKVARFESNKLDDLGEQLGLGRKLEHEGWELWEGCYNGDKKSWAKMKAYNKQDVELLERLYLRLRPYMKTHPNMGVYTEGTHCPKCDSTDLEKRGYQYNNTSKYGRIRCKSCGGWSRTRLNLNENKPIISI